jgi:cell division protein FtsB
MAPKGRHWAALWLLAFLAAAWIVIARQTSAIRAARELGTLQDERANLEGHRADLEQRIRKAESRAVLLRRARALGLRLPADTEITLLPVPGRPAPH